MGSNTFPSEIVMVRLQGDFAKPPEKRFNYKHCFDGLFRVSRLLFHFNCSAWLSPLGFYQPILRFLTISELVPFWRWSLSFEQGCMWLIDYWWRALIIDGPRRRSIIACARRRPKCFPCDLDERQSARFVGFLFHWLFILLPQRAQIIYWT